MPGSELVGLYYLRTVADADSIRDAIATSGPVVVIGAGWIGTEVAASAHQSGADVTVVDAASVPLERVLGTEVGAMFGDLHAEHGVHLRLGTGIESFAGAGTVEEVRLTDGTVVPAGMVVVGVGVVPRSDLAQAAGLDVDNGIITDEHLATSVSDVFAAGDVANAFHPLYGRRVRLEHWSSALNQGPAAAHNMLGQSTVYDKTPYFLSDQYDFGMEYRGFAPDFDEVVFRGDRASREFVAFWLRAGHLVAAKNANIWDQGDQLEALVRAGTVVDRARLADAEVDLADLAEKR